MAIQNYEVVNHRKIYHDGVFIVYCTLTHTYLAIRLCIACIRPGSIGWLDVGRSVPTAVAGAYAHISRWVIEKCKFTSDPVRGRTVLLVVLVHPHTFPSSRNPSPHASKTHNVALATGAADYALSYTRIEESLLADEKAYRPEGDDGKSALSVSSEQAPDNSSDGKLILAEEVIRGGGMCVASKFHASRRYRYP